MTNHVQIGRPVSVTLAQSLRSVFSSNQSNFIQGERRQMNSEFGRTDGNLGIVGLKEATTRECQ